MKQARWHTFQILTKRAERMLIAAKDLKFSENVWLGVSCEDQKTADERIPLLLQTPAAVRFVSAEPLLGPIDLHRYLSGHEENGVVLGRPAGACVGWTPSLDWAICGGESGPGARPFDIAWARAAIKQCQDAGAPVFMKQLGSRPYSIEQDDFFRWWAVEDHGKKPLPYFARLKDKKGGDPAEWPEDLRVREFPKVSA
jgi:protein gp37